MKKTAYLERKMAIRLKLTLALIVLVLPLTQAQIGGQHYYEFLNVSNSARITALGGSAIAVKDADAALGYFNPSSLKCFHAWKHNI